jgi:hypothetical protein
MIHEVEKQTIIKYLGKHPSRLIIPYLNSNSIFNAKGKSFSPKSIQNIINGETNNTQVELVIFKLVAAKKSEFQKLENFKKQTL